MERRAPDGAGDDGTATGRGTRPPPEARPGMRAPAGEFRPDLPGLPRRPVRGHGGAGAPHTATRTVTAAARCVTGSIGGCRRTVTAT